MLKFNVNISDSVERPVAQGFTVTAEGQALVADRTGGLYGVKPSTGASGEQFAGVSISQQLTPLYLPIMEVLTVPATGTYAVTLAKTPAGGTLRVVSSGAGVLAAGSPGAEVDEYSITGNVITVNVARAANTLTINYRYSPTTVELATVQGDIPPGGSVSLVLGSVGVIRRGDIYTSEYDTSVDWTAANPLVYAGANGLFTTVQGTAALVNCTVIGVPSASNPFLGLELRG